jgi:hypothetical protein
MQRPTRYEKETKMKVKLYKYVERTIRSNARKGARALDKHVPGWWHQRNIKLTRLDLTNGCECVYGQLDQADFVWKDGELCDALRYVEHELNRPGYCPAYDGNQRVAFVSAEADDGVDFELIDATRDAEWAVLQDEWEKQIRIRRRAAGLRAAA